MKSIVSLIFLCAFLASCSTTKNLVIFDCDAKVKKKYRIYKTDIQGCFQGSYSAFNSLTYLYLNDCFVDKTVEDVNAVFGECYKKEFIGVTPGEIPIGNLTYLTDSNGECPNLANTKLVFMFDSLTNVVVTVAFVGLPTNKDY